MRPGMPATGAGGATLRGIASVMSNSMPAYVLDDSVGIRRQAGDRRMSRPDCARVERRHRRRSASRPARPRTSRRRRRSWLAWFAASPRRRAAALDVARASAVGHRGRRWRDGRRSRTGRCPPRPGCGAAIAAGLERRHVATARPWTRRSSRSGIGSRRRRSGSAAGARSRSASDAPEPTCGPIRAAQGRRGVDGSCSVDAGEPGSSSPVRRSRRPRAVRRRPEVPSDGRRRRLRSSDAAVHGRIDSRARTATR